MNVEAESNKRFFEQLIEECVLNLKYGDGRRCDGCVDLTFQADSDEYLYPIGNDLSTIDAETFEYVRELATQAGVVVSVEGNNVYKLESSAVSEKVLENTGGKSKQFPHLALVALTGVMTDIIKDFEQKASGTMMAYLRKDKSFERDNLELFKGELGDLGVNQPTLIAFGRDAFKVLTRNLRGNYDIWRVPHYSNYTSMGIYREEIAAIIQSNSNQPNKVMQTCG